MQRGKQSVGTNEEISFQRATETDQRGENFSSRTSENSFDCQSCHKPLPAQHQRSLSDSCNRIIRTGFFFTFAEFCCSSVSCSADHTATVLPPDSLCLKYYINVNSLLVEGSAGGEGRCWISERHFTLVHVAIPPVATRRSSG